MWDCATRHRHARGAWCDPAKKPCATRCQSDKTRKWSSSRRSGVARKARLWVVVAVVAVVMLLVLVAAAATVAAVVLGGSVRLATAWTDREAAPPFRSCGHTPAQPAAARQRSPPANRHRADACVARVLRVLTRYRTPPAPHHHHNTHTHVPADKRVRACCILLGQRRARARCWRRACSRRTASHSVPGARA